MVVSSASDWTGESWARHAPRAEREVWILCRRMKMEARWDRSPEDSRRQRGERGKRPKEGRTRKADRSDACQCRVHVER